MAWRKWFVRLLVFTIVGGCACAVFVYQRFTNPAAVRDQVLAKLKAHFPGALVTVDSARLRILGGISINELRLARKDDPDKTEILHVPSAVLYHDKEKILEGELAWRRVELSHPHLRAQRNQNGTWNLKGIGGQLQPQLPLPTVVIRQGTLVLEDRSENGALKTVELTDVDLTLMNDPLDVVTIEGTACSEVSGKLHVKGQWQRLTHEVTLTFKARQVSLAGMVAERLEKLCPDGTLAGLKLEGRADLSADLAYRPESAQPLAYDVRLNVTKVKLQHPRLPLPLEEGEASVRCRDGDLRLEKLVAKSGPAEIEARGSAQLPGIEQNFEGHLEVRHLEMSKHLFDSLPEPVRKLYDLFQPTGQATFRADVARRAGAWTTFASGGAASVQLVPETMGVTFAKFPYPLERLTGTVDMNLMTKLVRLDVTGYTPHPSPDFLLAGGEKHGAKGPRPVVIKGKWQGDAQKVNGQFDIMAEDIPLDDTLVNALPGERPETDKIANYQKLAKSFRATGKGDIKAVVRQGPGPKDFHNEYHVHFHDTAIRWALFPYPLEDVSGYLDIYPGHWEFKGGKGTHHGCEVLVEGGSLNREAKDGAPNPGLILDIVGRNVPVDEELRQALEPMKLARSWDTFRPRGRLSFKAKIDHRTDDPEDADIDLEIRGGGGTIQPVFFPYALDNIAGRFHYHKNKLEIRGASASHQGTRLALDKGTVDLHPGGGYYTDLNELKAENLVMDEDLLRALPAEAGQTCGGLRGGAEALKLIGPITLGTHLVVAQGTEPGSLPDIYWNGQAWIKNAKFSTGIEWSKVTGTVGAKGRYNGRKLVGMRGNVLLDEATLLGQPFQNVQAGFQIKDNAPEVLLLNLKGPIFGGDISGEARIEFNSTLRYELNLTGSQLDLGQFGLHNLGPKSQLQGAAMARLHLTGQGTHSEVLEGNGSIDVPTGRLYNLPLLLDILKFLGLDRTAFEELHALFSIHGKRVSMRKLEILGNALSLTGQGEFNLDGTDVALDFYPGWARLDQILPAAVRPLPPAVSKNLLTIQMRGNVTANEKDRKFTMKPVPVIVDPLINVRNRLIGAAPVGQASSLPADSRDEPRMLPGLGSGR